jgi:nucleoside-diphosphate-sugar epimerase
MKVLITGSHGLVGRHFRRWFEAHRPDDELVCVDLKIGTDCRDFFKTQAGRFDLVIHLAALIGGRVTIEEQPLAVAVDLSIDAEMFNWALRTRPGRVIYYSSSAAYPTYLQDREFHVRLREDHLNLDNIRNPDFTYGWAKLTGEYLATFAEAEGVRTHVFRPFSGYAEDQDLDYPFPSFIERTLKSATEFEIWGDGTAVRDWIHIDDVVAATMKAVEEDVPGPTNLGWGVPVSFDELAHTMLRVRHDLFVTRTGYGAGLMPELVHLTGKPEGVHTRYCDNSKMLGFYTPQITLEKGIERALTGTHG